MSLYNNIFDAHAHYDDKWFDDDRFELLENIHTKVCAELSTMRLTLKRQKPALNMPRNMILCMPQSDFIPKISKIFRTIILNSLHSFQNIKSCRNRRNRAWLSLGHSERLAKACFWGTNPAFSWPWNAAYSSRSWGSRWCVRSSEKIQTKCAGSLLFGQCWAYAWSGSHGNVHQLGGVVTIKNCPSQSWGRLGNSAWQASARNRCSVYGARAIPVGKRCDSSMIVLCRWKKSHLCVI